MKKTVFAFLRMFAFVALMPVLSLSLVGCEPENGDGDRDSSEEVSDSVPEVTVPDSVPGVTTPDSVSGTSSRVAVDLGLSVKWASCNVGATSPEECGGYYAWGETEEKDIYDIDTYLYYNYDNGTFEDIGSDISGTEYDVAHVKWGDGWRMPTKKELNELRTWCTWTKTTLNGVNGYNVEGRNGNSIFLPIAGYRTRELYECGEYAFYWSSTLGEDGNSVYFLNFFDAYEYRDLIYDYVRDCGYSVRPVAK